MKRWGVAVALVLFVIACCAGMAWVDDRCQQAGGRTTVVGRGFSCVTPDGRLIQP